MLQVIFLTDQDSGLVLCYRLVARPEVAGGLLAELLGRILCDFFAFRGWARVLLRLDRGLLVGFRKRDCRV